MPFAAIITFIAGSLLTLYLGIIELRKGTKNNWKIAILFSLFLVFLYAGLYDILDKDDKGNEDKKEIILSNTTTANTIKEEVKAAIDSTQKAILDSINNRNKELIIQGDSNTNTILNSRSKVVYNAILVIAPSDKTNKNPSLRYSKNKDSLICSISFKNLGNDVATAIKDDITLVTYNTNKPTFFTIKGNHFFNKAFMLSPGTEFANISFKLYIQDGSSFENFDNLNYLYLKVSYKNFTNKKTSILRSILKMKNDTIIEVGSRDYELVEKDLIKYKYY